METSIWKIHTILSNAKNMLVQKGFVMNCLTWTVILPLRTKF